MECRRPLPLTVWLLGLAVGCSHQTGSVPATTAAATASTIPKAEAFDAEAIKRPPKAETFVAFGDFSAREAEAAQMPAEKEQLRDRARKAYQEALKTDPANVAAHKSLATLYVATGDHERARQTYEAALKLAPADGSLWYGIGMVYARTKDWGSAIDALSRATEIEPENRSYYRYLGFALARAGRNKEALAAFTRYEGEAKGHYFLAEMLEHLGKVDACKTQLQLALASDPQLTSASEMLVRLSGLGQKPKAPSAPRSPPEVQTVGYTEPAPTREAPVSYIPPPPPMPRLGKTEAPSTDAKWTE
jgi:tetratricopeptide (TPR) repeat protein